MQNSVGNGVTLCQRNGIGRFTRQRLLSQTKSQAKSPFRALSTSLNLAWFSAGVKDPITFVRVLNDVQMAFSPPLEEDSVSDSGGLCSEASASLLSVPSLSVTWRTSEEQHPHPVKCHGDESQIFEDLPLTLNAGIKSTTPGCIL